MPEVEKIKVVIADDEKKICLLLKNLIDWNALGMSIAGEAHDGMSAWNLIEEIRPEIAILDIRMPGMDGLKLLQEIRGLGSPVSVILISGHKHFEYAHTALKYGVENYLLKPINREELLEVLLMVKNKIISRNGEREKQSIMRERLSESMEKVRQNFLMDYQKAPERVSGRSSEEIREKYYLNFREGYFRFYLIHLDGLSGPQSDIVFEYMREKLTSMLKGKVYEEVCARIDASLVCCVNAREEKAAQEMFSQFLDKMKQKYYGVCSITVGCSKVYREINPESLRQVEDAVRSRIRYGADRIIFYEEPMNRGDKEEGAVWLKALSQALEIESPDKVKECFEDVKALAASREISPASLYERMAVAGSLLEGQKAQKDMPVMFLLDQYMEKLSQAATESRLMKYAKEEFLSFLNKKTDMREIQDSKYIRQAKYYIDEHYGNEISLEEVAGSVHINPSYFSSLFKKEQGINFSDYLIQVRIEKAKELLEEGELNVGEVGRKVGYKDQKYFSRLFYKVVGIKPSGYKKLYS